MVFRDELDSKARQGRHAAMLARRSIMLRDTHRPIPEDVYVAALPVLDWTIKGLSACMKLLAARQATLHVLDAGLKIPPSNDAELMYHVVEAFEAGRRRTKDYPAGSIGGKASAEARSARAREACERMRPEWERRDVDTSTLLAKYGVSRNTAKLYLGRRPEAQRSFDARMAQGEQARKQAVKRRAAKAVKGES
jgi:hypothetical protein